MKGAETHYGRGWILHIKPFQDGKQLIDALIEGQGRLRLVLYPKKKEPLILLNAYYIGWSGRGELKTCRAYEPLGHPKTLTGKSLFCALYLNELLERLLQPGDDIPGLFDYYERLLSQLMTEATYEVVLRRFEFWLLDTLGYACDWFTDAHSGQPVTEGKYYGFLPDEGIYELDSEYSKSGIPGENLLDILEGEFELPKSMDYAKWLMRQAYRPLLGEKPLNSRALFSIHSKQN